MVILKLDKYGVYVVHGHYRHMVLIVIHGVMKLLKDKVVWDDKC